MRLSLPANREPNMLDLAYVLMAVALYLASWWWAKKVDKV